jgi:hypothetical protein
MGPTKPLALPAFVGLQAIHSQQPPNLFPAFSGRWAQAVRWATPSETWVMWRLRVDSGWQGRSFSGPMRGVWKIWSPHPYAHARYVGWMWGNATALSSFSKPSLSWGRIPGARLEKVPMTAIPNTWARKVPDQLPDPDWNQLLKQRLGDFQRPVVPFGSSGCRWCY